MKGIAKAPGSGISARRMHRLARKNSAGTSNANGGTPAEQVMTQSGVSGVDQAMSDLADKLHPRGM